MKQIIKILLCFCFLVLWSAISICIFLYFFSEETCGGDVISPDNKYICFLGNTKARYPFRGQYYSMSISLRDTDYPGETWPGEDILNMTFLPSRQYNPIPVDSNKNAAKVVTWGKDSERLSVSLDQWKIDISFTDEIESPVKDYEQENPAVLPQEDEAEAGGLALMSQVGRVQPGTEMQPEVMKPEAPTP